MRLPKRPRLGNRPVRLWRREIGLPDSRLRGFRFEVRIVPQTPVAFLAAVLAPGSGPEIQAAELIAQVRLQIAAVGIDAAGPAFRRLPEPSCLEAGISIPEDGVKTLALALPGFHSFGESRLQIGVLGGHATLWTEYTGPHTHIAAAREAADIWLEARPYTICGPAWEEIVTGPGDGVEGTALGPEHWITSIFWPIESAHPEAQPAAERGLHGTRKSKEDS